MPAILFLKAKVKGDTHTPDLFATPVQVAGHMRGGAYVAPYTATRTKAADTPPAAAPAMVFTGTGTRGRWQARVDAATPGHAEAVKRALLAAKLASQVQQHPADPRRLVANMAQGDLSAFMAAAQAAHAAYQPPAPVPEPPVAPAPLPPLTDADLDRRLERQRARRDPDGIEQLPGSIGRPDQPGTEPSQDTQHRDFLQGPPVARITGDEAPTGAKMRDLIEWAGRLFEAAGPVQHPSLGVIMLDRRAASDSLNHGYGRVKVQALALLPAALPHMRVLAAIKREADDTGHILAGPVMIGARQYVLAALIRSDANRTRLYVHECVVLDALQGSHQNAASASKPDELNTGNPGAIRKVLAGVFGFKDNP